MSVLLLVTIANAHNIKLIKDFVVVLLVVIQKKKVYAKDVETYGAKIVSKVGTIHVVVKIHRHILGPP